MRRLGSVLTLAALLLSGAAVADEAPVHQPFWGKRVTGYLTTHDGVRLRYSALLPAGQGRFPVIVNYSGYDPGAIGGAAYLQDDTAMSVSLDRTLVEQGYAVVGVNARGTACSEGVFDFLGPDYGRDGRDAIEFIAAQSWSNGNVGMANWSWAGMSQIATASERPPHLKAIAPGMVLGDARLDSWAPGGVTAPSFVAQWIDYRNSRWDTARRSAEAEGDAACLAQVAANLKSSEPHSIPNVLVQHPLRDAFIEQRHLAARTHQIQVPVLSLEAFQDEAVTSREGYYQETLDPNRVWMIQTNGPHDLYESLRFRQTLVSFLDRFVKGEKNGFETKSHVEVWLETAPDAAPAIPAHPLEGVQPRQTIERDRLPVAVETRRFLLSGGGKLVADAGQGDADEYRYPVAGPAVDTGMESDEWGPQLEDWKAGSLAYTSDPAATGFVAYGSGSADLWLSSTATDTDLQVTLTELRPDGQEVFIQRGWLRASDRALDNAHSTPLRPVLIDRPDSQQALVPGRPVLARVELNKFAHPVRAGSRLRIWIDAPSDWGGYGFNAVSMKATNRIWHDADHPSALVLGVLAGVTPPSGLPACGSVLKQPCRPDPLK